MPLVVKDTGRNNRLDIDPSVVARGSVQVSISGDDNNLSIGAGTTLRGGMIEMRDRRGEIRIGAGCILTATLRCRADDARIRIGDNSTAMSVLITLHESGEISIGADCMLSGDIRMDVSDMHSILDAATGRRINPPANIHIGDHVWIGHGVSVLKGVTIGSHCVIGTRALVSKDVPPGSLAVGIPARVLRSGITWDRRRLPVDD